MVIWYYFNVYMFKEEFFCIEIFFYFEKKRIYVFYLLFFVFMVVVSYVLRCESLQQLCLYLILLIFNNNCYSVYMIRIFILVKF